MDKNNLGIIRKDISDFMLYCQRKGLVTAGFKRKFNGIRFSFEDDIVGFEGAMGCAVRKS